MERRALIALALSFVVFMAFIYYGEMTKTPQAPAPATQTSRRHRGRRPRRRPRQPCTPDSAGESAIGPSGQRRGGGHPLV